MSTTNSTNDITDRERKSEVREIEIDVGDAVLKGILSVPPRASAIVLFVHGSGSSRLSSRNRFVARFLEHAESRQRDASKGLATLLFDLLDMREEGDRAHAFDIELLTRRLLSTTDWVAREMPSLSVGYFGASTGAAAALEAAAKLGHKVRAVVSRGGRPDLAESYLADVQAPTLLIVGEEDSQVMEWNERAFRKLGCEKQLVMIPGAVHLFEEKGALERVAEFAAIWFQRFLVRPGRENESGASF